MDSTQSSFRRNIGLAVIKGVVEPVSTTLTLQGVVEDEDYNLDQNRLGYRRRGTEHGTLGDKAFKSK
jgi:hypothetical protein